MNESRWLWWLMALFMFGLFVVAILGVIVLDMNWH